MVVAGKTRGLEILRACLNPFHRHTKSEGRDDGANVTGINRDLVAKATTDIRRNDSNIVLWNAADQSKNSSVRMGSLRGHVDRKPTRGAAEVGYTATGFEWRGMAARKKGLYAGLDIRLLKNLFGRLPVADFPVEDVIILLLAVFAKQGRVSVESFVRSHQHRQLFVFHFHQLGCIGGSVAIFSNDERDFLRLKENLAGREHHLLVVGKCRHPRQIGLGEIFAGYNRQDRKSVV